MSGRWCSLCERLTHHDGSICTTCFGDAVAVSRAKYEHIQAERAAALSGPVPSQPAPTDTQEQPR